MLAYVARTNTRCLLRYYFSVPSLDLSQIRNDNITLLALQILIWRFVFRYLATGDSYFTLATAFRMSKAIVSKIISETCTILWEELQKDYMPTPTTEQWHKQAKDFENLWQFPNCVGAVDGKHINIQAPANSGLFFFKYKKCSALFSWL